MGKVTNLVNNEVDDIATSYAIAGGSTLYKKAANRTESFNVQVIWTGIDAFDGSLTAQGSNDDAAFDDLPAPNQILINSANGSASIQCNKCDAAHHGFNLNVGTATVGNIKVLLNENR